MPPYDYRDWQLAELKEWMKERLERSTSRHPDDHPAFSELRVDYLAWCAKRSKDGKGHPVGANTMGTELQLMGESYSSRSGRVYYHGIRLREAEAV